MKKLCMILAALAMTTGAFAQQMWVGGSLNLSATSNTHNLYIRPSFGYFVADNISVEGTLGLDFNNAFNDYGLVAVGRYWMPVSNGISYTPGLAMDFRVRDYEYADSTFNFGLELQLASFNYSINDRWGVTANFCSLNFGSLFDNAYVNFVLSTSTTLAVRYFF